MITLIAAMDKNGVIGKGDAIPWHLPADFAHFKEVTTGHPVIMGSATYKSIGKPLPNRTNIILSRSNEEIEGCIIAHSLKEAFDIASKKDDNIFIIGGASVYEQALPFADRLDLALIDAQVDGDIFFPKFDAKEWIEKSRKEKIADEKNKYSIVWVVYERK